MLAQIQVVPAVIDQLKWQHKLLGAQPPAPHLDKFSCELPELAQLVNSLSPE